MPRKLWLGAGCYWGTQKYFDKQFPARISTSVGFMGGSTTNPTYRQVCNGDTGHAEVMEIVYEESKVKTDDLIRFFFRMHDSTTLNSQGNDRGTQYRSVIFYQDDEQRKIAETVRNEVTKSEAYKKAFGGRSCVTELSQAGAYTKAQDDHQDYLEVNPGGYCNHKIRF